MRTEDLLLVIPDKKQNQLLGLPQAQSPGDSTQFSRSEVALITTMTHVIDNSYDKELNRIAHSIIAKVQRNNVTAGLPLKKRRIENSSDPGAGGQTGLTKVDPTERKHDEKKKKNKKREEKDKASKKTHKEELSVDGSSAKRHRIVCHYCVRDFEKKSHYMSHIRRRHHGQGLILPTPSSGPPALIPCHNLPSHVPSDELPVLTRRDELPVLAPRDDLPSITTGDDLHSLPTRHYIIENGQCHCKHCFAHIPHPKYVAEHIDGHDKRFECPVCQLYLASSALLKVHKAKWHGSLSWGIRFMRCPECPFITENSRAFEKHIAMHGNPKVRICQECKRPFLKIFDLQEHVDIEHGSSPAALKIQAKHPGRGSSEKNKKRKVEPASDTTAVVSIPLDSKTDDTVIQDVKKCTSSPSGVKREQIQTAAGVNQAKYPRGSSSENQTKKRKVEPASDTTAVVSIPLDSKTDDTVIQDVEKCTGSPSSVKREQIQTAAGVKQAEYPRGSSSENQTKKRKVEPASDTTAVVLIPLDSKTDDTVIQDVKKCTGSPSDVKREQIQTAAGVKQAKYPRGSSTENQTKKRKVEPAWIWGAEPQVLERNTAQLVTDLRDFKSKPYACSLCFYRTKDIDVLLKHVRNHVTGGLQDT